MRIRRCSYICHSKHIFETTFQRIGARRSRWGSEHYGTAKARQTKPSMLLFRPGLSSHLPYLALDRCPSVILGPSRPDTTRHSFAFAGRLTVSTSRILLQRDLPFCSEYAGLYSALPGFPRHLLCSIAHQAGFRYHHGHSLVWQQYHATPSGWYCSYVPWTVSLRSNQRFSKSGSQSKARNIED